MPVDSGRAELAQAPVGVAEMEPRRRRGQEAKAPAQQAVRGTRYEDQFFKTKMCMFWEKGACTRGTDCKYAHGDKELNEMPNLTKTSLCRDLLTTGSCTRPGCLFAHNVEELRATNEFYKTSMCSFFRVGQCKLGSACRHAHDPAELVDLPKGKEFAQDDAEVSQIGLSGRAGRRGGRKAREKHSKTILTEDDDELPESFFDRMTTSPATFGWVASPQSPESHGTSNAESISTSTCTGGAASQISDEDDNLDDVPDMWARMKTTPAPSATMVPMNRGAMMMGNSMIQSEIQAMPVTAAGQLQLPQMQLRQQSPVIMQQMQQVNGTQMQGINGTQLQGINGAQVQGAPVQNVDGAPMMMVPMQMPMVFVQVPMQPQQQVVPMMQKGPYMDTSNFVRQMSNEMEAKILESAMPEVYED